MTPQELKSVAFSEEDVKEIGGFIREGIHSVTIEKVGFEKNANDKPYLNVEVKDENGNEGAAKIWFTGAAIPYSINTIRTIFVHNASNEEDKEKLRQFFKGLEGKSLYELSQFTDKLVGKQAWYSVRKTDETYEDKDGNTKSRYDRSIWGYEPTFKDEKETASKDVALSVEEFEEAPEFDLSDIPF